MKITGNQKALLEKLLFNKDQDNLEALDEATRAKRYYNAITHAQLTFINTYIDGLRNTDRLDDFYRIAGVIVEHCKTFIEEAQTGIDVVLKETTKSGGDREIFDKEKDILDSTLIGRLEKLRMQLRQESGSTGTDIAEVWDAVMTSGLNGFILKLEECLNSTDLPTQKAAQGFINIFCPEAKIAATPHPRDRARDN